MSIFKKFGGRTPNKKLDYHCDEAKSFIQVHYVRERDSDRYKFNTLTIKNDPQRDACEEWYRKHGNPDTFSEIVDVYLAEGKIKPSIICNEYGLENRVFDDSNNKRTVEKWEAISVCFGLDLNLAEARRLLKSAGYALTNSSDVDLAIRYCFENNIYLKADIDYILNKVCDRSLNQVM